MEKEQGVGRSEAAGEVGRALDWSKQPPHALLPNLGPSDGLNLFCPTMQTTRGDRSDVDSSISASMIQRPNEPRRTAERWCLTTVLAGPITEKWFWQRIAD